MIIVTKKSDYGGIVMVMAIMVVVVTVIVNKVFSYNNVGDYGHDCDSDDDDGGDGNGNGNGDNDVKDNHDIDGTQDKNVSYILS